MVPLAFSPLRERARPTPYFPSDAERAASVPAVGAATMPPRPPAGIFGAPLSGVGNGFEVSAAAATAGRGRDFDQPAASSLPSILQAEAPQINIDPTSLMTPIDPNRIKVKQPGFFDKGGLGERVLKGLGEWGLRMRASEGDPYALTIMRNRFERQQAPIRAEEEQRRRLAEREEWVWRQKWGLENSGDQFTQYMRAAGIDPTSPQGQALYRQRAENMAAPPFVAFDGFDAQGNPTKTFMPRPSFGMSSQSAPAGPPVGTIRNGFRYQGGNPNDRSSRAPVGGAPSPGGAAFR